MAIGSWKDIYPNASSIHVGGCGSKVKFGCCGQEAGMYWRVVWHLGAPSVYLRYGFPGCGNTFSWLDHWRSQGHLSSEIGVITMKAYVCLPVAMVRLYILYFQNTDSCLAVSTYCYGTCIYVLSISEWHMCPSICMRQVERKSSLLF